MPMEYIVPSVRIAMIIEMTDFVIVEEILLQLVQLEEDAFVTGYQ